MKIKRFEFNMLPVNCYLAYDNTKEAVIIDPGCLYTEEKEFLRDYIASKGLTVKHQLCTHLHLDHVFGCKFIKETYGLGIEANPADEYWLEQAPHQARAFGLTYPEIKEPIETPLFDGDIITFGNLQLEAICVPGHSPGNHHGIHIKSSFTDFLNSNICKDCYSVSSRNSLIGITRHSSNIQPGSSHIIYRSKSFYFFKAICKKNTYFLHIIPLYF